MIKYNGYTIYGPPDEYVAAEHLGEKVIYENSISSIKMIIDDQPEGFHRPLRAVHYKSIKPYNVRSLFSISRDDCYRYIAVRQPTEETR